jgi:single-stranded-DNA-specific exonuclease
MKVDNIWEIKTYDYKAAQDLNTKLGISPLLASLLLQRGVNTYAEVRYFLYAGLNDLQDPFELIGLESALKRIRKALEAKEKIIIYGDYDVDGICSIVLLKQCLHMLGTEADYYVPDRFSEGYGLNLSAVEKLVSRGYQLLISVDCGITSVAEVERAQSLGMDVIICDHHTPAHKLPPAKAIINPRLGNNKQLADLAGAGVVFKLCQALCPAYVQDEKSNCLELAALATVADVVPLTGENRILVKYGLMKLQDTNNPGLQALIKESGLGGKKLSSWHIGFVLAPRLNSAGRLESAGSSIELLLTDDLERVSKLAAFLCNLNSKRREIEEAIYQEALLQVEKLPDVEKESILVLGGEGWHQGVTGIVASRLCEKFRRPVIMISWDNELGKGSCRSLPGLNIYEALSACCDYLRQFGGHRAAAGLSIYKDKFADFRQAIGQWVKDNARKEEFYPRLLFDAELDPEDINEKLLQELKQLEPFGEGNPSPRFVIRGVEINSAARMGKQREHFRARLGSKNLEIIAFNRPELIASPLDSCLQDILFEPQENEFRGIKRMQLKLSDMKNSYFPDDNPEPELELLRILRKSSEEIGAGRPVVFVYPTYRSLVKHKLLLRSYFRLPVLQEIHGHINYQQRSYLISEFSRGQNRIFMVTRAFINYYLRNNSMPNQLKYIFIFYPDQAGSKLQDYLQDCMVYTIKMKKKARIIQGQANFDPQRRVLLYTNRNTTLNALIKGKENLCIEAGVKDVRKRKAIRHQFLQSQGGILVSDGINTCLNRMSDIDVVFADAPYSIYEAQMVLDQLAATEEREAQVLFNRSDLDFNRQYLNRTYPEIETIQEVLSYFKELPHHLFSRNIEQMSASIGAYLEKEFRPSDLMPVLEIMVDLGLCQFKKKGSIMAIKFIKSDNSRVNIRDSLYNLEGQIEKKEFNRWEKVLNNIISW